MSLSKRLPHVTRFYLLLAGLVCAFGGAFSAAAQNTSIFGPNVYVFDPTMSPAAVNSQLNALNAESQFSTHRYAVLFKPGSYGTGNTPVLAQVGFYESIAGLGTTPSEVTITGGLASDELIDGNMTQNFWRSQENLTEVPVGGLTSGILDWGVSQGASLRRISIQGGLFLTNSGSIGQTNPCAESSGGFIADTNVSALTNGCSQQQWYTRNSILTGGFSGNVWNFVFSGVLPTNTPAQSYPGGPGGDINVTNLATTPVSREKPFLYLDGSGNYNVFVPTLKTASSGTSWSGGTTGSGYSMPIGSFFIATPTSTLSQINAALSSGMSLILTPGIYQYSGAIQVTNANTIVLGMGYATIVPQSGTPAITVADVDGVQLAGLLIDAGPVNSPVLLELGNPSGPNTSHATNPTSLNDVFFRIGGGTLGSATTSLQVDSGNVILDNIWAWRADHGNNGTVGWTVNTAAHGLVVNGNNVTALGLAVEHYQQSQVLWNGNGGQTIFYQSELPYDPPSQSAWSNGTANGYPSYAVAPSVCTHTASGLGIYSFFDLGINIVEDSAMTVPTTSGIAIKDAGTVWLNGSGQISNVINATGGSASAANPDALVPVSTYIGSGTCAAAQPPAAPGGLTATYQAPQGNGAASVALTWTASSTSGVIYTVYRSTGSGAAVAIQSGLTATSFSDITIAASTTYTYYVVAVDQAGTSPASNSQSVTTGVVAPQPPTNLVATAVSSSQINLTWTASTTPGVSYEIFGSANTPPTISEGNLLGSVAGTSYSATGLTGSTLYYYAVVAIGSTTSTPARASATTNAPAPQPPTNLVATAVSSSQINLTWTASTTPGVSYEIFGSANTPPTISEGNLLGSVAGTSYSATGLTASTLYYYAVIAIGSTTSTPARASATTNAPAPQPPTNLVATAVSSSQINLTWTASTTPGVSYEIFGSANTPPTISEGNLLGSVAGTSYSATGLTGSTLYYYAVVAIGSTTSTPVRASATTNAPAPQPPTNLVATAVSSSQINLTWTASTTPGVSYEIFGSANTPPTISEGNLLGSVAGTSYSATGLTASTLYYYAVVAIGSTTSTPVRASATTQASTGPLLSINAGGGSVGSFIPDTDFSGGATYANSTPVSVAGVANAAPVAVYQDQREGVFTYTVPGLVANSKHTVTLHFAELYFQTAGSRQFNVSINGTPVLTNFDVVQTAGSAYKAVVEQFQATATANGQIVIQFTRGAIDQPAFNGLVIQ